MFIKLRVSPPSAKSFTKTFDFNEIRIGRDPSSHLCLDSDENGGVSWEHARIELRADGAYLADSGSTNGTYCKGQAVNGQTELNTGDTFRLGKAEATIEVVSFELPQNADSGRVAPLNDDSHAEAAESGTASPSPTRLMVLGMQRNYKKLGLIAGVVSIAIVALVLGVIYVQGQRASSVEQTTRDLSRTTSSIDHRVDQADSQLSKLDQRLGQTDSSISNLEKTGANIFKQYAGSVYLVVGELRDPRNGNVATFSGTAFAIDKTGVFATNAHVASPVKKFLDQGGSAKLISQRGMQSYDILDAKPHPAYDPNAQRETPDVGIVVARLSADENVKPVEIATVEDLRQLEVGSPLFYVGFPVYRSTDYSTLSKANARFYKGTLVRKLTLTEEGGNFQTERLLEHDMYSWGSASGSPIFNSQGKVVAIHYAGNPVHGKRQIASAKWAMRIDFLDDLSP